MPRREMVLGVWRDAVGADLTALLARSRSSSPLSHGLPSGASSASRTAYTCRGSLSVRGKPQVDFPADDDARADHHRANNFDRRAPRTMEPAASRWPDRSDRRPCRGPQRALGDVDHRKFQFFEGPPASRNRLRLLFRDVREEFHGYGAVARSSASNAEMSFEPFAPDVPEVTVSGRCSWARISRCTRVPAILV